MVIVVDARNNKSSSRDSISIHRQVRNTAFYASITNSLGWGWIEFISSGHIAFVRDQFVDVMMYTNSTNIT